MSGVEESMEKLDLSKICLISKFIWVKFKIDWFEIEITLNYCNSLPIRLRDCHQKI